MVGVVWAGTAGLAWKSKFHDNSGNIKFFLCYQYYQGAPPLGVYKLLILHTSCPLAAVVGVA